MYIVQTEAFEFVLMERRNTSVINAQKLILGSHQTASSLFPIRFLTLGVKSISVVALSAEASNSFTQRIVVKVWHVQIKDWIQQARRKERDVTFY